MTKPRLGGLKVRQDKDAESHQVACVPCKSIEYRFPIDFQSPPATFHIVVAPFIRSELSIRLGLGTIGFELNSSSSQLTFKFFNLILLNRRDPTLVGNALR